jgi:hypothetical protein
MTKNKNKMWTFKRILGFDEFQDCQTIIKHLNELDGTEDFSKSDYVLFEKNRNMRLWIISSKTNIYIVRDIGDKDPRVLLKRAKPSFNFKIVREKNMPRLYISNTTTTLPFDTNLTGDTKSFEVKLKQIKDS